MVVIDDLGVVSTVCTELLEEIENRGTEVGELVSSSKELSDMREHEAVMRVDLEADMGAGRRICCLGRSTSCEVCLASRNGL